MSNIEEIRKAGQLYEDFIALDTQRKKLEEALKLNEKLLDENQKLYFSSVACAKGNQPTYVFWNTYSDDKLIEELSKFDRQLYSTEYKFNLPSFEQMVASKIAREKTTISDMRDAQEIAAARERLEKFENTLKIFLEYFNLSRDNIDRMAEIEMQSYTDWID